MVNGLVVVGADVWEVIRVSEQLLELSDLSRCFAVVGSRKNHLPLACLVSPARNMSDLYNRRRGCP